MRNNNLPNDSGDGDATRACHMWDDAPTGGVSLCTRPEGHGGMCVDRVHNRNLRNPRPAIGRA